MDENGQLECARCRYPLAASQLQCPECGSFYRRVPVRAPEWMMVIVWVVAAGAAVHAGLAGWSSRDPEAYLSMGLHLALAVVLGGCAFGSFLLGRACKRYPLPAWAIVYCLFTGFSGLLTVMSCACWG